MTCCAPGCDYKRTRGATCSMFVIPSNPQWLRAEWLNKIKRDDYVNGKRVPWTPSPHSRLCSCHFEVPPDPKSRKAERKFAVPTIFAHATHQSKPRTTTKSTNRSSTITKSAKKRKLFEDKENVLDVQQETAIVKKARHDVACNTSPVKEVPSTLLCHDYMNTTIDESLFDLVDKHPDLKDVLRQSEEFKEKADLLDKLNDSSQILCLENIKIDKNLVRYYTGFPYYDVFKAVFEYLRPKAETTKYPYGERTVLRNNFKSKGMKSKPGRPRSKSLEEEFFMTLVRLRIGIPSTDCAIRFGIAESTFSSIFTTWVSLIAIELEKISKMPATSEIDMSEEAECFEEFSNLKVIIDCTELFAETPSSLNAHKQFHSNYKHHSTVKFLVGMNTGGAVTYVSNMYGGRASDKFITNESVDFYKNYCLEKKLWPIEDLQLKMNCPLELNTVIRVSFLEMKLRETRKSPRPECILKGPSEELNSF